MGNDLRDLSASALTILNNPAVIAINQDPRGLSATRVRRERDNVAKDKYGVGEIQVWSGALYGDDQVVVLLNAGNKDSEVSATLAEIFIADGPEGSAAQVYEPWEYYDAWAMRMEKEVAEEILEGGVKAMAAFKSINWYNSTELSYKEGLKKGDERLFGKLVGRIEPEGTLTATVRRHAVRMFRLRRVTKKDAWRKSLYRDEL